MLARWLQTPSRLASCALLVVLALGAFLYFAPTPSSYGKGMEMLGQPATGLYLGRPQAIRSDEWLVYTPYVQMAVAKAPATDTGAPYHVPLRSFMSLPVQDWGLAFKPYYWGFLVLPPAQAFATTYLFHSLAFVLGWMLLFRVLGVRTLVAFPGALALYWAQFTQVWWTTNAGSFAYGPWVVVAWATIANPVARTLVASYLLCTWVIASGYPPFLYAFGLALAVLVAAFRRDLFSLPRVATALVAIVVAAAVGYAYYDAIYAVMANTVYPGDRRVAGGGVPWQELLAHLLPWFSTTGFEPIPQVINSNACEIGVLGSILPAAAIAYTPWRTLRFDRRHLVPIALVLGTLAFVLAWALALVPGRLAALTLLDRVHPNRLLATAGILVAVVSLRQLSSPRLVINAPRHLVFLSLLLLSVAWKATMASIGAFDAVAPLLAAGLVLWQWTGRLPPTAPAIVGVAAVANLLTFGTFNPVQSADPIFHVDSAQVQRSLLSHGARFYKGALVAPGNYGALIAGAGVPSYNQVLLEPRQEVFRKMFAGMPEAEFQRTFNRYAHVSFGDVRRPTLTNADLLVLPLDMDAGSSGPASMVRRFSLVQRPDAVVSKYAIAAGDPGAWGAWNSRLPRGFSMRVAPGSAEVDGVVGASAITPGFTSPDVPDFPAARDDEGEMFLEVRPLAGLSEIGGDATVDSLVMDAANHLTVVGWLPFDARDALTFTLYTDGGASAFSAERVDRPDVASIVSPALFNSGFRVDLDLVGPAARYCLVARTSRHPAAKLGGTCK